MEKRRILMATMNLELGGAETHIVELSRHLKKMGHHVAVCSDGGIFTDELTADLILHYKAPLNRRKISDMFKSLLILNKVIKKERPDVVHAHARIPAMLCWVICRLRGVPLVTTVHRDYDVSWLLKRFTKWGDRVIAVSEDLKRYVKDNYKYKKEISLTVNGIDTERFAAGDPGGLRSELGIPPDTHCIVYVSRMDEQACMAAVRLLDCIGEIPNACAVIVGSGDYYEKIVKQADEVNAGVGHKIVYVTGGRIDVQRFLALADVFVGVSRAALEAMASERVVVLAGNQGYLGLFTEDSLEAGLKTNFTCRGYNYPDDKNALKDALIQALSLSKEERQRLGKFGRNIIQEHFSVDRMAQDAQKVYLGFPKRKQKTYKYDYVIAGYYGFENSGDEALLSAITHNLNENLNKPKICVLVKKQAGNSGIKYTNSINRFNILKIYLTLRESRCMLFGGGNLLQDETSKKSLFYYLTLLKLSAFAGTYTMLYANGVGPLLRKSSLLRVGRELNKVDIITLRDKDSYLLLKELNVSSNISVTADEAFTIELPEARQDVQPYICVSMREWKGVPDSYWGDVAAMLDRLCERLGTRTVFIPLQYETDYPICQRVASKMNSTNEILQKVIIQDINTLLSYIGGCELIVGMRLHLLIFGACASKAMIGLSCDPKIKSFVEQCSGGVYINTNDFTLENAYKKTDELFANLNIYRKNMEIKVEELRALAKLNAIYAEDLIK